MLQSNIQMKKTEYINFPTTTYDLDKVGIQIQQKNVCITVAIYIHLMNEETHLWQD